MSLLHLMSRLTVNPSRCISTTPALFAEPLKKKKKLDPQIIKQREDRRKRRLEKQIRRLEKNARQLKPVDELEVPLELIDQKGKRLRKIDPLTDQEKERRIQLTKQWTKYKHQQKVMDFQIIDRLWQSQNKALAELRLESEELYQEAIQFDMALLPQTVLGPVSTPPIEDYIMPDGDFIHHSKKWE